MKKIKVKILHKTPKGKIIGRTNQQLKINSMAFLKAGDTEKMGKVYDIFGPVNSPYVKIIPFNETAGIKSVKIGEVIIAEIKNSKKRRRPKKSSRLP